MDTKRWRMELLDKRYEDFRLFKLEREKVTTNWISSLSGNIFKLEPASLKIGPFRLVKYSTRKKKLVILSIL